MASLKRKGVRVGVLMSGGVDSSVAAALLQRQGYEVLGVTLQLWDYDTAGSRPRGERGCCDISHQMDARFVCEQLGIRHVVIDLRTAFREQVVEPYERTYLAGRTPNPCIVCNTRIKWGEVLRRAEALSCEYIATGHYARVVRPRSGGVRLLRGRDKSKDQSYALWELPTEALQRTLLPLGRWRKGEIRALAKQLDLRTAGKAESQEVCFISERYDDHLRSRYPAEVAEIGPGQIVTAQGEVKGSHDGFFSFTIGQRRGLNISDGRGPYYVTDLVPERNLVVAGPDEALKRPGLVAQNTNWISCDPPQVPTPCRVKIRYNDPLGAPAWLLPEEKGLVTVRFDRPVRAVTPGQSAVFYRGENVWGGGIIRRALKDHWTPPAPWRSPKGCEHG